MSTDPAKISEETMLLNCASIVGSGSHVTSFIPGATVLSINVHGLFLISSDATTMHIIPTRRRTSANPMACIDDLQRTNSD